MAMRTKKSQGKDFFCSQTFDFDRCRGIIDVVPVADSGACCQLALAHDLVFSPHRMYVSEEGWDGVEGLARSQARPYLGDFAARFEKPSRFSR